MNMKNRKKQNFLCSHPYDGRSCGACFDRSAQCGRWGKVEVKVGAGSWQLASGTTSWSVQVTLSPDSNTIYARATDTSGNIAETSVMVSYVPATPTPTPTLTLTPTPTITPLPTATSTPVPVKQPLLTVSQTALKEDPDVGEEVLITVSLQNNGDGTAKNIRLTEAIPSSISVSFIDGATSSTPNLVTWNGELAPSRAHAIMHTLKILEKKGRAIPVIVRYEDEAGSQKETSTTIYVEAQATPAPTKTPENLASVSGEIGVVKVPGFAAPLALAGLVIVVLLARRR